MIFWRKGQKMSISIKVNGWSSNELIIKTSKGEAKVWIYGSDIRIEHEDILKEIGLSASDAIALFFDKAADKSTREKFQTYLSHK
jgi:hypothetical protein